MVRDLTARKPDVVFSEHVWHIQTLRFSPDGRRVVSAGWDGVACIWDPVSGHRTAPPLQHRTGVGSVAFSPDGGTLLTLGGDTQLHFWSVATGEESLAYPGGAAWFANFAAPDGRMLAWDVGDGAVKAAFHPLPTLAEVDAGRTPGLGTNPQNFPGPNRAAGNAAPSESPLPLTPARP